MNANSNTHTIKDWLWLHDLNATAVNAVLDSISCDTLNPSTQALSVTFPDQELMWDTVAKALNHLIPELGSYIEKARCSTKREFNATEARAYTYYEHATDAAFVSMSYRGTPNDALCMAHEFGHAVQIACVSDSFVLPIQREIAAFLSEFALLTWTRKENTQLHQSLMDAFIFDNVLYYDFDVRALQASLTLDHTKYDYRWNYPVARFFAEQMYMSGSQNDIVDAINGHLDLPHCVQRYVYKED